MLNLWTCGRRGRVDVFYPVHKRYRVLRSANAPYLQRLAFKGSKVSPLLQQQLAPAFHFCEPFFSSSTGWESLIELLLPLPTRAQPSPYIHIHIS